MDALKEKVERIRRYLRARGLPDNPDSPLMRLWLQSSQDPPSDPEPNSTSLDELIAQRSRPDYGEP